MLVAMLVEAVTVRAEGAMAGAAGKRGGVVVEGRTGVEVAMGVTVAEGAEAVADMVLAREEVALLQR